jgi:hypothetical protein
MGLRISRRIAPRYQKAAWCSYAAILYIFLTDYFHAKTHFSVSEGDWWVSVKQDPDQLPLHEAKEQSINKFIVGIDHIGDILPYWSNGCCFYSDPLPETDHQSRTKT